MLGFFSEGGVRFREDAFHASGGGGKEAGERRRVKEREAALNKKRKDKLNKLNALFIPRACG